MQINTTIVDAYLNAEDVSKYASEWFYTDRTEDDVMNIFCAPPASEAKKKTIVRIRDEIIFSISAVSRHKA